MSATRTATAFSLTYAVTEVIDAPVERVWGRLTDAAGFTAWNSTVTRLDGPIALGQRLTIEVPIAPGRTFRPTVVELVPHVRMVWRDGTSGVFQGTRTFTLTPTGTGTTLSMEESFRGLFVPMIGRALPDFRPVFDQYVQDLARACR